MTVMWALRLLFYCWALYEIGLLSITYYSMKNSHGDKTFIGLLFMSLSVLALIVVLMIVNLVSHFFPVIDQIIRFLLILPIVFIAISSRVLRSMYKKHIIVK